MACKGGDDQGGLAGLACRIAVWSSAGYTGRSINYLEAQACTYLIAEQFSACSIHAAGQIRAHDVGSGIGCMEEPENRVSLQESTLISKLSSAGSIKLPLLCAGTPDKGHSRRFGQVLDSLGKGLHLAETT